MGAWLHRAYIYFSSTFGGFADLASIFGLALSMVGFYLTIKSVRQARRAAEDARRVAGDALDRIGSQLFANDISLSLRLVKESRDACRLRHWWKAADRCDETRTCIARLRSNKNLTDQEREKIGSFLDDLNLFLRYTEKLIGDDPGTDLSDQRKKKLDDIITFLAQIEGRIQSLNMEMRNVH